MSGSGAGTFGRALALAAVCGLVAGGLSGCVVLSRTSEGPTEDGPPLESTATVVPSGSDLPSAAQPPAVVTPAPQLSQASLDYAKGLGGTSHAGETLYFVIGQSLESEAAAQAALEKARPSFGDMQDYFFIQRSENFEGMRAGWWVVIEAHRGPPSEDVLQFARRGFPDAYPKRATVKTTDPIPVYDDVVGLAR